jgi:tryptophan synthase alpha chain
MSRIERVLRSARTEGRAGLIAFLTAGDPDPDETVDLLAAVAEGGADVIELGIPFSDPLADGIAIQRSSARALSRGVTMGGALEIASLARGRIDVPIVLFGYLNSFLAYGPERLAAAGPSSGVDGVLLTDLPIEEGAELRDLFRGAGFDTIQLVAPTSAAGRLGPIASESRGFIYCISRAGVTGRRDDLPAGLSALVASVRRETTLPVAVGFGISTPAHVRTVAAVADAVVVGSALVETIAAAPTRAGRLGAARSFIASLAEAL